MADAFFLLGRRLMFASLHGRDADMLSFQAALQSPHPYGISRLGFRQPDEKLEYPIMTTAEVMTGLSKHLTKYPTHNYGLVTHMFLYAEELATLNRDAKHGWVLLDDTAADLDKAAWHCLQQLSDIPLLDQWRYKVLDTLTELGCINRYTPGINENAAVIGVQAVEVRIPDDFDAVISNLLCSGKLPAV
ncbi:hypothetical protein PL75_10050 [Neisseria arctica]|uniref:Uncharacterized protein n=2 Tax=Neisseria arctica TaxID=1470200 RepID=A0A0J1C1C0_9NEIS|nr:hypothetical protein PL75_10050 [Neisseria arctica]